MVNLNGFLRRIKERERKEEKTYSLLIAENLPHVEETPRYVRDGFPLVGDCC
jgi:hypothetical protein